MLVVAGLPNRDTVWEFVTTTINGVVNVASVDASAQAATQLDGSAMVNEDVDIVAPGIDVAGLGFDQTWGMSAWSGNSAATPIVASLLALAKQKWPDASGSQLLQSMIRNTGSTPHELQWSDTFGHGIINATRLVQEDPTQYPDENPLSSRTTSRPRSRRCSRRPAPSRPESRVPKTARVPVRFRGCWAAERSS